MLPGMVAKPYYDHDGITIYNGDCRELLPEIEVVDLVLTDPPWGINANTDNSRFSGGSKGNMAKRGNGIGTANGKKIVGEAGDTIFIPKNTAIQFSVPDFARFLYVTYPADWEAQK